MRALAPLAVLALLVGLLPGCASFGEKPAWERPPPPTREAPVVQQGALERNELDNGLKILVLEDHRLPRVGLAVTFRRGEALVDPVQAGLSAFTAALMERGAGDLDALRLAESVENLGASLSVSSDWDAMTVQVGGLSRDLDVLLGILADVVLRPRFDRGEARKARSETLAALERAKDDPATLVRWNASRALYGEHRFGLPLAGSPASVEGLDEKVARAFYDRIFLPNNAILSASGDVDTEELIEKVASAFGTWQPGTVPAPGSAVPSPAPLERRIVVVDRPDLGQARIIVGHDGIGRTEPERIAVSLMNSVLGGGGFSSRLMRKVRAEEGLTYGVNSGFRLRREPGPFSVGTFTRVAETRRVVDLLLQEMERVKTEPPTAEELAEAKTLTIGRFGLSLETSGAVMAGLVDLDVYGLPDDSLDTYRSRVRAITPDDTARAATERLHPGRAAIVVVGPAETLVPMLEDLGPVEVVQP